MAVEEGAIRQCRFDPQFMDQIRRATLARTVPIIWFEPPWPSEGTEPATCFIMRFSDGLIGVTAKHVYDTYIKAKRSSVSRGKELVCCLKNCPFDLETHKIHEDDLLDVMTFRVTGQQLSVMSAEAFDCRGSMWPPPQYLVGGHCSLAGYPKYLFDTNPVYPKSNLAFGAFLTLSTISNDRMKFVVDPDNVHGIEGIPKPPFGVSLSGCSGGPVVLPFITHNGIREVTKIVPIAVIVGGANKDDDYGRDIPDYTAGTLPVDIIWCAPIKGMSEDGKFNVPWLPGAYDVFRRA